MPRIVACLACGAIEKLIDPDPSVRLVPATIAVDDNGVIREHTYKDEETGLTAMVPEHDPLMEDVAIRHSHGLPDLAVIDNIKVWSTDQDTYDALDAVDFVKQSLAEHTDALLHESNYYKEEAIKCYNKHGNPDAKDGCIDFLEDHKRIGSSKVPKKAQVYLCHMCPYMQTYVMQEMRHKFDLYENPVKFERAKAARNARMARKSNALRRRTRRR